MSEIILKSGETQPTKSTNLGKKIQADDEQYAQVIDYDSDSTWLDINMDCVSIFLY